MVADWSKVTSLVSIHAPREGCDASELILHGPSLLFQFTHPGRGATSTNKSNPSDLEFQFTHPGRGATPSWLIAGTPQPRFNSRTPGGVRLELCKNIIHE